TDEVTLKTKGWPANARILGTALHRIAPNLRAVGISVEFSDQRELGSRRRQIAIQKVELPERSHRSDRSGEGLGNDLAFPGNAGQPARDDRGNAKPAVRNNGNDRNGAEPSLSGRMQATPPGEALRL